MDVYDTLTADINQKIDKVVEDVEAFRLNILRKIEDARNNEILTAIKAMDSRLGAMSTRISEIESKLPPVEEK